MALYLEAAWLSAGLVESKSFDNPIFEREDQAFGHQLSAHVAHSF